MQIRKGKLIKNVRAKGKGGTTFRATLPTLWVRELGLSEDERDIILKLEENKISIYKDNSSKGNK